MQSLAGKDGVDGKSAYELAVANGYEGTEAEWLRSLAGANGKSAYEIAVENGYKGTELEWLASLVGEAGANGKSAYELAVENGYNGTVQEWLATLVGPTGAKGADGKDGLSAYELAVANGYNGDLASWLDSLIGKDGVDGKDGASAYELAVANGFTGSITEWLASLVGADGKDGASAYELAVANGYSGSVNEWLQSLVGVAGADGKSAYEIAVDKGYKGTEEEWLASLQGAAGEKGEKGDKGNDGVGISNAYIDSNFHLILVLTDGTKIDAGCVRADSGVTTYTVIFRDYDGTVLKTETVEEGKAATAPANPSREGYRFTGWDKTFSNITSNLVVTAMYELEDTSPRITVSNITASAGETLVAVPVSISNNPGILGMTLTIEYDESVMTLTKVVNGSALTGYSFTPPKNCASGCRAAWYINDLPKEIADGNVMILYFTVSSSAVAGSYDISVSCADGDTFDADYNTISLATAKGYITVK